MPNNIRRIDSIVKTPESSLTQFSKTKQVVAHKLNATGGGGIRVVSHKKDNSFSKLAKSLGMIVGDITDIVSNVAGKEEKPQEDPEPNVIAADKMAGRVEGARVNEMLHEMVLSGASADEREAALAEETKGLDEEDKYFTAAMLPHIIKGAESADKIENENRQNELLESNKALLKDNVKIILSQSGGGITGDMGEEYGDIQLEEAYEDAMQMGIVEGTIDEVMVESISEELQSRIDNGDYSGAEYFIDLLRGEHEESVGLRPEVSAKLENALNVAEYTIGSIEEKEQREEPQRVLESIQKRSAEPVEKFTAIEDTNVLLNELAKQEPVEGDTPELLADKEFNKKVINSCIANNTGQVEHVVAENGKKILGSLKQNRNRYDEDDLRLLLIAGNISPNTFSEAVSLRKQEVTEVTSVGDFIALLEERHGYDMIATGQDCELFNEEYDRITGGKPVDIETFDKLVENDKALNLLQNDNGRFRFIRERQRPYKGFDQIQRIVKHKPSQIYNAEPDIQQSLAAEHMRAKRIREFNQEE